MFQYFSTILYVHYGNSREGKSTSGVGNPCAPRPLNKSLAVGIPYWYAHGLLYYAYCGLYYMKCGLVDHNVVESVNILQIFFTFFTSVY